jgi:hypothetical protein
MSFKVRVTAEGAAPLGLTLKKRKSGVPAALLRSMIVDAVGEPQLSPRARYRLRYIPEMVRWM